MAAFHGFVCFGCLFLAFQMLAQSLDLVGKEGLHHTFPRTMVGVLLGASGAVHVFLMLRRQLTFWAGVLFYPFTGLLVVLAPLVVTGSIKRWAPATAGQAVINDIFGYGALILMVAGAVLATRLALIKGTERAA